MAEQDKSIVCSPSTSKSFLSCKQSARRQSCDILSSELQQVRQDILSYEKVIQVLREELIHIAHGAQQVESTQSDLSKNHPRNYKSRDGWHQVSRPSRLTKSDNVASTQFTLNTFNKFDSLSNLKDDFDPSTGSLQTRVRKAQLKNTRVEKHKVLILGDSHARSVAPRLQYNLGKDYAASSYVKPGAQMKDITIIAYGERKKMNSDDVLVLWGGSNDISKKNMRNAITEVFELVKDSKETNIVLISAPHRHDLIPNSCVNKEVCKYDRIMKKLVKLYTNVNYLETDLERSNFTKHGFHLNSKGKDLLVHQLVIQMDQILNKPKSPPISTYWEITNSVCTSDTSYDLNKGSNFIQQRRK